MRSILTLAIVCMLPAMFTLKAQSVGGTTSGGATYCDSINSGFISLSGYTGTILDWQFSSNGGATWTGTSNITAAQSYFNLSQTTCYRAIVQNGAFPPDTSSISCITVYLPSNGGTVSGGGSFCDSSGTGSLTLSGNTGGVLFWLFSTNGGASWTTVADTNTTLLHPNINVNTIYAAVVQNGPSCPMDTSSTASFTITTPSVAGTLSSADTVCNLVNSGLLSLSGNTGSVISWAFSVDNGTTWTPISSTSSSLSYSGLTQTTWYTAVVQNGICAPATTLPLVITVLPPVMASAGTDTTILLGQSLLLNGAGTGSVLWTPSTGLSTDTILNPSASPQLSTTYVLTITDANGCTGTDNVIITVIPPAFNGTVTNLFSPNGDGINDFWYVQDIQNFPDNQVFIYNIYGNEVFSAKNYANDWDGSGLPDGTYYYVLKFDTSSSVVRKGSVDIIRSAQN